jgi:hypothetical protein
MFGSYTDFFGTNPIEFYRIKSVIPKIIGAFPSNYTPCDSALPPKITAIDETPKHRFNSRHFQTDNAHISSQWRQLQKLTKRH